MKKKVSLLLALGLVCTTVLSGRGGSTPTEPQTIADATTEAAGSEASTEGRGGRYSGRCSGDDVCT